MNHPPIEGTHDHCITHAHPVNQSTARDNVLIQPHTSNEGHGKRRDIMVTNMTSKQRPRDSETSPVRQRWDSPILIDNKHDPAPCRTHHGRGLDTLGASSRSPELQPVNLQDCDPCDKLVTHQLVYEQGHSPSQSVASIQTQRSLMPLGARRDHLHHSQVQLLLQALLLMCCFRC